MASAHLTGLVVRILELNIVENDSVDVRHGHEVLFHVARQGHAEQLEINLLRLHIVGIPTGVANWLDGVPGGIAMLLLLLLLLGCTGCLAIKSRRSRRKNVGGRPVKITEFKFSDFPVIEVGANGAGGN